MGLVAFGTAGVASVAPAAASATTTFSINDVSVLEGNAGTTNAVFTITRGGDLAGADTIDYTTTAVSATADVDYTTTAGTASFAAGAATATVTVPVVGDTTAENDETFTVDLSNASDSGVIADAQGTGTILDDEAPLTIGGGGPGSGSQFFLTNNETTDNGLPSGGSCASGPGLAITDATLDPLSTSTRRRQSDAYDDGLELYVNNTQLSGEIASATATNGQIDSTTVNAALAGLNVSYQYKALQSMAVIRSLATLTNPSSDAITVPVAFATNNGSDGGTIIQGTSSGDTTVADGDSWVVTSDSSTVPGDPVNTHVVAGPGSPALLPTLSTTVFSCASTPGILATFNVTIPAGATRSLMFFNQLSQTNESALSDAQALFSTNPAPAGDLVSDLTDTQLSQILNWSLAPLKVTKAADSATSVFRATNGYAITVANPNQDPVDLDSVTDTLPAGFTYVPGSSSVNGTAIADPTVGDGNVLTWAGPITVPAAGSSVLHFNVKVPSKRGTYTDTASAAAAGYVVRAATDQAPVEVRSNLAGGNQGYDLIAADGGVFSYGAAQFVGTASLKAASGLTLNSPVVNAVGTPSGLGYWMVAADGGVFAVGDAEYFGSMGGTPLNKPIVAIARTITGKGYWLIASDGGIFSFGDATFFGSTGALPLNKPIVGGAATPSGAGYWLVASDGGIFSFGDAGFLGSTGDIKLNKPVVDMVPTPTGSGYWLAATDGGIFSFGDAAFFGSTGDMTLNKPVIAIDGSGTGAGYRLVASDGGIFSFGDAAFFGSAGNLNLNQPIVAITSVD